jgi:hypothetical protein
MDKMGSLGVTGVQSVRCADRLPTLISSQPTQKDDVSLSLTRENLRAMEGTGLATRNFPLQQKGVGQHN